MSQIKWHPGKLLEVSGSYWMGCTLHTSVKFDIFTCLGDGSLTAAEMSKKINTSEDGIERLLNALTAMGLLKKNENRFSNTKISNSFLNKESSKYIGYMIQHHHHLVDAWAKLDKAVTTGKPVRTSSSITDDETQRENFLMGMFNLAMSIAPNVAKEIDLKGHKKLIDLGGGPGTYAIYFCLNNPDLKASVFDFHTTRPFAEKNIKKFGLSHRINFIDGNFLKDNIEEKFDTAWLSHILHGDSPEDCQEIIKKTVSALEPGGLIFIHDFILEDTMDGPLFPSLFSLNMLLGTNGGRSYSQQQISDMLTREGIINIKRLDFQGPNDSGIITGQKQ